MMMTTGGSGGSTGVMTNPPGGLPAGTPGDPYDLGTLPDGFDVRWPNLPMITQDIDVTTKEQLTTAASTTGTRIHVKAAISGGTNINADDIEIVMDDGASVGNITIPMKRKRIRLLGGTYGSIALQPAIQFYPTRVENIEWQIQDVTIDGISIPNASVTGMQIRGDRVAVLRSYVHAVEYSLYSDSITNGQNSDIIVAGNNFVSEGSQATLRLISVHNGVVVDNHLTDLENMGQKHNYRIHGISDHAYGARNILVGSGVMMGTMDGDALDQIYFDSNTFYHDTPDLFNVSRTAIKMLHAHDNVAYTDVWASFIGSKNPAEWDIANNVVHPYMPEPTN